MVSTFSTLLHPLRLEIVLLLQKHEQLSIAQMSEHLPHVPQATLYRHIAALTKAKIIYVSASEPIRGTMQKYYSMKTHPNETIHDELLTGDTEKLKQYFFQFLLFQQQLLDTYLLQDNVNIETDGFGFRSAPLNIPMNSIADFSKELHSLIQKYSEHTNCENRSSFLLSTILIPTFEEKEGK
ncbi:MAG: helix-turn-helix domain-containing protein [Bacilli bacterium]